MRILSSAHCDSHFSISACYSPHFIIRILSSSFYHPPCFSSASYLLPFSSVIRHHPVCIYERKWHPRSGKDGKDLATSLAVLWRMFVCAVFKGRDEVIPLMQAGISDITSTKYTEQEKSSSSLSLLKKIGYLNSAWLTWFFVFAHESPDNFRLSRIPFSKIIKSRSHKTGFYLIICVN